MCFVTDTIFKKHLYQDDIVLYKIIESTERALYIAHSKKRYATKAMQGFIELTQIQFENSDLKNSQRLVHAPERNH